MSHEGQFGLSYDTRGKEFWKCSNSKEVAYISLAVSLCSLDAVCRISKEQTRDEYFMNSLIVKCDFGLGFYILYTRIHIIELFTGTNLAVSASLFN
jgi:hypothetical protein